MNTTKIGKWLVVLNAGMAVAFLMWAVAIYTQRIDWFTPKEASGGEKVAGQIEAMAEKHKIANAAHSAAYTIFANNKSQVDLQEGARPARRDFYRGQIALGQSGLLNGQPVPQPFQQFESVGTSGLMAFNKPTGRPAINYRPNEPLLSIADYAKRIGETTAQLKTADVDVKKLVEDLRVENDKITGTDAAKGLRTYIKEQESILNGARDENDFLGTTFANLIAETTLFTKRLEAMRQREKELDAAGRTGTAVTGR